ncbi:hypothetical protein LINPERPRIM_LOCUS9595 [Linum perenne]
MWDERVFEVEAEWVGRFAVVVVMRSRSDGDKWMVVNVYGPQELALKRLFVHEIKDIWGRWDWTMFSSKLAIHGPESVKAHSVIEGWKSRNCVSSFKNFGKFLLHAFVWIVWGERNNRIFRDSALDVHKLGWQIAFAVGRWAVVNREVKADEFGNWLRVWRLPVDVG